jgi:hypothetical protein
MNVEEILNLIDQRIANLEKASDHTQWVWDTDQDLKSWGNHQFIGGSWAELMEIRQEIISIMNEEVSV